LSSIGHRVQRVHDQVHQYLFDLAPVRFNAPEIGSHIEHHLDVLSHQGLEHRIHIPYDRVQIQHAGLKDLLPAECQQLAGDTGSLLRGVVDEQQFGTHRMILAQPSEQDFTAPDDHRQQIVEIVSDASGETSHSFHLVRGLDFFLKSQPGLFGAIPLRYLVAKNFICACKRRCPGLDAGLEFFIRPLQLLLESLPLCNIPDMQQKSGLPEILDTAGPDPDRNRLAIGCKTPSLKFGR
jgi:hypothetical protein